MRGYLQLQVAPRCKFLASGQRPCRRRAQSGRRRVGGRIRAVQTVPRTNIKGLCSPIRLPVEVHDDDDNQAGEHLLEIGFDVEQGKGVLNQGQN